MELQIQPGQHFPENFLKASEDALQVRVVTEGLTSVRFSINDSWNFINFSRHGHDTDSLHCHILTNRIVIVDFPWKVLTEVSTHDRIQGIEYEWHPFVPCASIYAYLPQNKGAREMQEGMVWVKGGHIFLWWKEKMWLHFVTK
jgi:hypothetical protein